MSADADHPTLAFERTFADGQVVADRYRIVRFIAAGGMGEVWEADDLELGGPVAIKTVRAAASTPEAVERLKREIQLARRVTHPNVCRIFDIARHGAVTFVTMELLRGVTLATRLREQGRFAPSEALPIVSQLAEGLAAAHRAGVIHRDFKSENVLLSDDGRAVITDFGLARATASETHLTRPGEIVGTAAYLAPEQCDGREVGPAADIYAFGVVLFEMITGARPFTGESLLTTVVRKLHEAPSSPRVYVPTLDLRWEAAILRCLERDPHDRFDNALDVLHAISGDAPVTRPSRIRERAALYAAIALVLVAVAGAILQYRATRVELQQPRDSLRAVAIPRRPSVAVLGFRNVSGRDDAAWLSTALSEMLTTELAAEGRLRTIPGEQVQRAKIELNLEDTSSYSPETLARIRKNLGADLVVFGSYVVLDDQLRVDIRVQDATGARADTAIAETGAPSHLFDLVTRVGARMRETLGVQSIASAASTTALGVLPSDPEAARLYAEGLAELRGFNALGARDLFDRAAAKQPDQPVIHSALATAWSALGYDKRAREEARKAFELSPKLPREQRLLIEAGYRESVASWDRAADIYRALTSFFPDNLDYGLRLANAQTKKGSASDALGTLDYLRRLPDPLGSDPRIDLAEVDAQAALSNYAKMQAAAERAVAKGDARGARILVARGLSGLGAALHRQGRTVESISAQQKSLEIFRDAGDSGGVGRCLVRIGAVYTYRGEIAHGKPYFAEALGIGEKDGDAWLQSAGCNNLAFCAFMEGEPQVAEKLLDRMLQLAAEVGDPKIEATARDNRGYARFLLGDLPGAQAEFSASATIAEAIHTQQVLAVATANLGDVLLARGDLAGARRQYESAMERREKIGEKRAIAESRVNLANVAIEEGRADDAIQLANTAATWAQASKVWDVEALARNALARALIQARRIPEARREIAIATELAGTHENLIVQISILQTRARVAAAAGDSGNAQKLADEALARTANSGLIQPKLEAALTRAEVATGADRARLAAAVQRDAQQRGFTLFARKAAALQQPS